MVKENEFYDSKLEIMQIKSTLDRILTHHDEFKTLFKEIGTKIEAIGTQVHEEETDRISSMQSIKDELHGRINQILFSILGGAGLFVVGIIMWIIETKK